MKNSKEIKVAILVLSGIAFFIFGFNYLKGKNLFDSSNLYYTEFNYNALAVNSPVTIMGNAIGKVEKINYNFDTGKTSIGFTVDSRLNFSKNSTVMLYETGLMGGNALAIVVSNKGEKAKPGDLLKSEAEEGLIKSLTTNFSGLSDGLDTTLKSTDSLMSNLNKLVSDDSDKGIKATIAELNSTLKSFKSLSNSFNKVIAKNEQGLSNVITNFEKVSQDFSKLSNDLKDVKFSETVKNLDKTLANVNALMSDLQKGKGTMGKLLKDEKLYDNLTKASKEIESLLKDIKLHPKRYFRILSKKEIPYKEETED